MANLKQPPVSPGRRSAHLEEEAAPVIMERERARAKEQVHKANIREMEEHQMRGELIEKGVMERRVSEIAITVKSSLLALPQRLSAIMAMKDEPYIRALLDKEIRKAMEALCKDAVKN